MALGSMMNPGGYRPPMPNLAQTPRPMVPPQNVAPAANNYAAMAAQQRAQLAPAQPPGGFNPPANQRTMGLGTRTYAPPSANDPNGESTFDGYNGSTGSGFSIPGGGYGQYNGEANGGGFTVHGVPQAAPPSPAAPGPATQHPYYQGGMPGHDFKIPGVNLNMGNFQYQGTPQTDWNQQAQGRLTAQGPQANWGPQNDALNRAAGGLGQIQGAADFYRGMANGTGPNLGQTQLQSGIDQSIHAQQAMAASAQGGPLAQAAAMRQAAGQGDATRAGAVNQAAQLQQQAQIAGAQGLMNAGTAYGNLGSTIAGQYGQQGQAQLGADVTSQGQNFSLANSMMGYGSHAADQAFAGTQNYATTQAQLDQQAQMGNAGASQAATNSDRDLAEKIISGAMGAVGSAATIWALTLLGGSNKGGQSNAPSSNGVSGTGSDSNNVMGNPETINMGNGQGYYGNGNNGGGYTY